MYRQIVDAFRRFHHGFRNCRVSVHDAAEFVGPAIVEQLDATTVVEPGDRVRVDALGNLEIRVAARGAS